MTDYIAAGQLSNAAIKQQEMSVHFII